MLFGDRRHVDLLVEHVEIRFQLYQSESAVRRDHSGTCRRDSVRPGRYPATSSMAERAIELLVEPSWKLQ